MSSKAEGRGVSGEEFQIIKKERIAERRNKTEAKRHDDLQRIRNMKSRNGIEPLDQFPKEIWEIIFEPLSPNDLGNTWKVHPSFQEILKNRRIRDILFPQILNFKVTPFWMPEIEPEPVHVRRYRHPARAHLYEDDEDDEKEKVEEKPLALAEFAKLREVSKSLRDAIDQWHEEEIIKNLRSEEEAEITSFTFYFPQKKKDKRKLNGIIANFSGDGDDVDNKARRFFLRSLKIVIEEDDAELNDGDLMDKFECFESKITKLLELVGHQIWRFEYIISDMDYFEEDRGMLASQFFSAFQVWARRMPNLKWLVLRNETESGRDSVPSRISRCFSSPRLEHLERVSVAIDTWNNAKIFHMFKTVLKANQHVKAINVIPGTDKRNRNFFNKRLNPFMKSKSLSLALETYCVSPEELGSSWIGHIQPAINVNWQLKQLHVGGEVNELDSAWKSIFHLLEKFQTLEHLTLRLEDANLFDYDIPFLKLPNLTHLKLELVYNDYCEDDWESNAGMNFIFSLQFLLYVKKLEKLEWKLEMWNKASMERLENFLVSKEDNEKGINFRAGMRDLRSSNLWDCFPELESVEVELRRSGSREKSKKVTKCQRGEKL